MRCVHEFRVERVYPVEWWILRLPVFPWCKDSPQIVMLWREWLGRLNDDAQLVWTHQCCFFLRLVGVRESGPPIFSLFRLCRFSYIPCRLCNRCMTFAEMHVKWSVTLADRLGPAILTVLEIKGQVLHRVRLDVKVPGWLSNLNALLAKKSLPKFCRVWMKWVVVEKICV